MVKDYSRPAGWRYDSHRHALAAKGVSTTPNKYFRRKNPQFGRASGLPLEQRMPQPRPQAPFERRVLSAAMYDALRDKPESLQKAIASQNRIKQIEQERAMLDKDWTRTQSNVAAFGKYGDKYPTVGDWAKEIVGKTPINEREAVKQKLAQEGLLDSEDVLETYLRGSGRDRVDVEGIVNQLDALESKNQLTQSEMTQMALLQAQLDSLGELEGGKIQDDIRKFNELTKSKSLEEKEFARVTGFMVGTTGGEVSASRVSPSERAKLNELSKLSPDTASEDIPLNLVVPSKTRTGELMVPSSPLRVSAAEKVAVEQERRAKAIDNSNDPLKLFPGRIVSRPSAAFNNKLENVKLKMTGVDAMSKDVANNERVNVPLPPGQIRGDLRGTAVSIFKNPAKSQKKIDKFDDSDKGEDREYRSGRVLFGAGLGQ